MWRLGIRRWLPSRRVWCTGAPGADGRDELAPTSKKSSGGKKNGIEKTKEVAATRLKKAKQGTTVEFNWIKEKTVVVVLAAKAKFATYKLAS
ncbi:hypothetical protein KSP40_PGU013307 [Platanthera guangdongensis]|uniref:Uncharacterized protein n=1 Tax=Platanthera guangdongensis TaxID=2320717 RepID=A0ABR2MZ45_9ASPA